MLQIHPERISSTTIVTSPREHLFHHPDGLAPAVHVAHAQNKPGGHTQRIGLDVHVPLEAVNHGGELVAETWGASFGELVEQFGREASV